MRVQIDPKTELFIYYCPDVEPAFQKKPGQPDVEVTQNYVGRIKHATEGWMIVIFLGVTAEAVVAKAQDYWDKAMAAERGKAEAARKGREASLAAQAARQASKAS